jgi:DNA polymerase-3 subunit epsilon
VEAALLEVSQLRSLPPHLPPTLPEELPEGPGVYRFYGEGDALLYVGKAANIRSRVLGHWQGATRDSKSQRLAELTRRVDWTETAGELGALLLEARLVRELQPLYNRRLRGAERVWTWVVDDDGAPPRLEPVAERQLSFAGSDAFGLFRTERSARSALLSAARDNRLCLKVLGLEQSAGSCFAYQLGRCEGACIGAEPMPRHTARVKLALSAERLKPWPFEGAIGIRETGPAGLEQLHVIDTWRYLGTVTEQEELPRRRSAPFDLESYRILTRFLGSRHRPRIVNLPRDPAGE